MAIPLSILVVDDDPIVREEVARLLRDAFAGLHVMFAKDGAEGLEIALRLTFNLIVTDLRMPRLTGLEMLELLRRQHNHTPAMMISSSEMPAGAINHAGAFLFLPKHELALLPDYVRRLLGSSPEA